MTDKKIVDDLIHQIQQRHDSDLAHAERVRDISLLLGQEDTRFPDDQLPILETAALLHDVGTLNISPQILYKDGRLNLDEYEEVQAHTTNFDSFFAEHSQKDAIIPLIRHHHENINGFGYPDGIEGDDIPLGARIIHVAEALDSMVKRRQKGFEQSLSGAIAELQKFSGRMYDATLVDLVKSHQSSVQKLYQ